MLSGIFGLIAAWRTQDWRWLPGAVLILANWPYTLLVVKPTNDRLDALTKSAGAASRTLIVTSARTRRPHSARDLGHRVIAAAHLNCSNPSPRIVEDDAKRVATAPEQTRLTP